MRRAARTDANQEAIVQALRKAGASVQSLAAVGQGVPDLLVGYRGVNVLMECKDGTKTPSKRPLTSDQVEWVRDWRGQTVVVLWPDKAVQTLEAAVATIGGSALLIAARR